MAESIPTVEPVDEDAPASRDLALEAARAMDAKQASDIVIEDVGSLLEVTDFFVICTAANRRRAASIADEVEERLRGAFGVKPIGREGLDDATWILLDYGSIVVHVFQPAERDYYRLEQLWDAAPTLDVALAGIEDPVYSERIAALVGREAAGRDGAQGSATADATEAATADATAAPAAH